MDVQEREPRCPGKKDFSTFYDSPVFEMVDGEYLLSEAERGRIYTWSRDYAQYGTAPDLEGEDRAMRVAWASTSGAIDRASESYLEKCKKNSENARKRWDRGNATPCDPMRPHANDADIDRDSHKDIENEKHTRIYTERVTEKVTGRGAGEPPGRTQGGTRHTHAPAQDGDAEDFKATCPRCGKEVFARNEDTTGTVIFDCSDCGVIEQ